MSAAHRNALKRSVFMAKNIKSVRSVTFDYFLILDFEATCDNTRKMHPQEIIEFPVLKLNSKTLETEAKFHRYIKPQVNPILTPFCTELTGIIQDMVSNEASLSEVLKDFDQWMIDNHLLQSDNSFVFVTCGDWDLKMMLPDQCNHFNLERKSYFSNWINIKKIFAHSTSKWPRGLLSMLEHYRLPHIGHHHSGIDDCLNIANIFRKLMNNGYQIQRTDISHYQRTRPSQQ
ncbi:ERI1 exoribonuclease 3 isoform X2 [Octopus bimaculoides]|uniref:Exonuclease domain-containing protein n=1 Tax=Octopus bimaculoides TaxID=37653 RepID=A0A0L8IDH0_OCTBM|nr:ERI1 exoribonuclease 3 isoform X2 [Octopus bimaculoides]|eukprot:XP_014775121.1 PREDICTED: ERI1 exoribonuclease 3-like isoform X2 [Octopus bimaculoides]